MSVLHVKHLLIGGGAAGVAAAQALRRLDREGSILLVAQERSRPYDRRPLGTTYLRREITREALFSVEANWFELNHVELRTSRRASQLDAARRKVTLDNGEEVSFDRLLIATGAVAKALEIPGARLPGVYSLRTIEDADTLRNAVDASLRNGRKRATVIGGTPLAMEIASTLTQLGLAIDLVADGPWLWNAFAGETAAKRLALQLEQQGVVVHAGAPPLRLEGDGRVQRVALADGRTFACDFAVNAIGLVVNKDLLRGSPVEVGKAILVDDRARTNVPDVFAAGECCAIRDRLFGKHRWLDGAESARVTGELAGRNMAGADESYVGPNHIAFSVFDLTVDAWGEPKQVDRRVFRDGERGGFIEIGLALDGRIAHAVAAGAAPADLDALRLAVARRATLSGREDSLRDTNTPLAVALGEGN